MPNASAAVRVTGLRLDRGARTILRDIDLSVPRGSVTAILGPSGCGKSTLLSALTGELDPAAGTVEVLGQPVPRRKRELLELRKTQFSLRMQGATQQLTNTSQIGKVRKDIARIKTILRAKQAQA